MNYRFNIPKNQLKLIKKSSFYHGKRSKAIMDAMPIAAEEIKKRQDFSLNLKMLIIKKPIRTNNKMMSN